MFDAICHMVTYWPAAAAAAVDRLPLCGGCCCLIPLLYAKAAASVARNIPTNTAAAAKKLR
jgi:hypothetical protein